MSGLDHKSLSVVCRTTKLFHKYAVGILWRSLDGILPLMKLFPEEVVTYDKKTFIFRRVLEGEDWTRFEYYAPFVRAFSFDEQHMPWTSLLARWAESLFLRSVLVSHKELLPALTGLEWKATTSTSLLIGLPHFITQKLDSLSIRFCANDATNALSGLAGLLEPNPPLLSNLELILCFKADSESRSLSDTEHLIGLIFRKFPGVSRLRSNGRIFLKLSRVLQNLREIYLDEYVNWRDTPEYDDNLLASRDIFLPRLEYVHSHGLDRHVQSLLHNSQDTVLGFMYSQPDLIQARWRHKDFHLGSTFKVMGERFINLTFLRLQDVRITLTGADMTGSLLPFRQCAKLQEFDIMAEAGFVRSMSDDDISQMAGAWPGLKKFVIRYSDFEKKTKDGTEASDVIPFSFVSIATFI